MRIGIDIDGVITDRERFITDYGTKFCIEKGLKVKVNPGFYDETKVFEWTEEQAIEFWNEYLVYYATKYKGRDFASEVIHKLKEEGHEIYIVTARNEWGLPKESYGKMKEFVNRWLEDTKIEYDKIIYTEGSKVPYCVGNYIDIMIEDSPENIKDISKKLPVLCFNCEYNKNVKEKNMTRVYSWYDIYNKIKTM